MSEEYRGKRYRNICPTINNIGNVYVVIIKNGESFITYYIQVIGIAIFRVQSGREYFDMNLTQNLEVGMPLPTPMIDSQYAHIPHIIDCIIGYDEDNEHLFGNCILKPE